MTSPIGATMSRRELLLTLSEELGDLSAAAVVLQGAIGGVLTGTGNVAAGAGAVWQLQEIDRIQQTLDDLSAILRRAARDDGASHDIEDLAGTARLGALRQRLRGAEGDGNSGQAAGIVAMF